MDFELLDHEKYLWGTKFNKPPQKADAPTIIIHTKKVDNKLFGLKNLTKTVN